MSGGVSGGLAGGVVFGHLIFGLVTGLVFAWFVRRRAQRQPYRYLRRGGPQPAPRYHSGQ